ncbi:MAG: hypothetical protein LBR79_03765 [Oscillospiraceae bacterium]|nr:hypothetical protein [Oscillospiraceae bacterium]
MSNFVTLAYYSWGGGKNKYLRFFFLGLLHKLVDNIFLPPRRLRGKKKKFQLF